MQPSNRGGAYAEWDFLRGIKEGWIPHLPSPYVASEDLFGTCLEIHNSTNNDYNAIIEEYPDPEDLDWNLGQGWEATDDFVLSDPEAPQRLYAHIEQEHGHPFPWLIMVIVVLTGVWFSYRRRWLNRDGYESLK